MKIDVENILVIIPCFNEEASITKLLLELDQFIPRKNILVIDDGSTDRTSTLTKQLGFKCLKLIQNCGIGVTVQTGFLYALRNDFSGAIQLDGDGQHPPDQIQLLIDCAQKNFADVVIGSRFVGIESFRSSHSRRLGIRLIAWALKILFRLDLKDTTSGFRFYGPKALKLFATEYPADYPEPISLALAAENKFNVLETPVVMRERQGGTSSIIGYKAVKYMVRVLGYLCLIRIGRHLD
jgi:glycosyltransferase involved in cell wall biosynthesis